MKFVILAAAITVAVSGCAGGSKKSDKDMKSADTKTSAEMKKDDSKGKKMSDKASDMASSMSKTMCAMKNDKRVVDVRKNGKGCELAYSKFGNEEIVATSMSGTEHCQKIADRITGNLENAGFECNK